jgi:hypothetical protein
LIVLIHRFLVFTFAATCALTSSVRASDERALASVAAADGFTYAWLPTEGAVVLTRPGVRIVLRPGRLFYEVNNATPIADRAPTFDGEDLLISPELAKRIHEISLQHATSVSTTVAPAAFAAQRNSGPALPLTVALRLVPGRLALAVGGTGTPNTSITITLRGEISNDLPNVLIRRTTVAVDAAGTYSIEMSYGPDAHSRTTLTATAASATGTDHAIAHVFVDGTPTAVPSSGIDEWPKK